MKPKYTFSLVKTDLQTCYLFQIHILIFTFTVIARRRSGLAQCKNSIPDLRPEMDATNQNVSIFYVRQ